MAERKAEKHATKNIFRHVAEDWHAHWKKGKTERHTDNVLRRLKADVFPGDW